MDIIKISSNMSKEIRITIYDLDHIDISLLNQKKASSKKIRFQGRLPKDLEEWNRLLDLYKQENN